MFCSWLFNIGWNYLSRYDVMYLMRETSWDHTYNFWTKYFGTHAKGVIHVALISKTF